MAGHPPNVDFEEVGYTILQYLENAIAICRGAVQGEAIEEVTSAVCLYHVFFEARDPTAPDECIVDILGTRKQLLAGVESVFDAAKECFDVEEGEPERDVAPFTKAAVYLVRLTVTSLLRHLTQTRSIVCTQCARPIADDAVFCDREHGSSGGASWYHLKCAGLQSCPFDQGVAWRCPVCELGATQGSAPRRKSSVTDGAQVKVSDIAKLTHRTTGLDNTAEEEEPPDSDNDLLVPDDFEAEDDEAGSAERALRALADQLQSEIEIETQRNNALSKQIMTCGRDEERAIKAQLRESDAKIESLKKRIAKLGVAVPEQDESTVEKHQADIERLADRVAKLPNSTLGVPNMSLRPFQIARAYFFLKAANWNMDHAEKKIVEHLEWRAKHRPDLQTEESMAYELNSRKFYGYKTDRLGNRCIVFKMNRHVADRDHKRTLRHWTWLIDVMISRSTNPYQKVVVIYDRRLCTRKNIDARLVAKIVKIFNKNYPGRLAKVYLLNADTTFRVGFALVKAFLTKEQRERIVILSQREDKWQRHLVADFGAENLQVEFGGTDPFVYEYKFEGEGKEAERVQQLCANPRFAHGTSTPLDGSPTARRSSATPGSANVSPTARRTSGASESGSAAMHVEKRLSSMSLEPIHDGEKKGVVSPRTSKRISGGKPVDVSGAAPSQSTGTPSESTSDYLLQRHDSKKARRESLLAALKNGFVRLETSGDAESLRSQRTSFPPVDE